ncbi:phage tail tape measure protein, TP901 family, core region [Faunimonas pinastri]|uniref:Phage tail tape measure protein, TP901 family, core region n=1 Tax=Faunimonas pinastri TaxID=1855383 RepID=A0A1H9GEM5_9HYPH|nr:phage tail tape measure protein [Faunimonas pinastri]SEQ48483.1 phage tail tape measure protein, TP901 family, core region [Faunimonas pinastri]
MSNRIISAEARITAKDATNGVFEKIAGRIDKIGKATKGAQNIERLSTAIGKAGKQLEAIDRFGRGRNQLVEFRKRLDGAQKSVQGAARAMEMAEKPTRKLETALKTAQAAVVRASAAYEKQADAVHRAQRALKAEGVDIGHLASEQKRLEHAVEGATAALAKQQRIAERRAARHQELRHVGALAGGAFAYGAEHFAERSVETYREFDKERRYAKVVMGLTDEQQLPLVQQAIHGGGTTKYNDIQWLEAQRGLAARGLNRDQVLGLTGQAANLGQSLDLTLPEAATMMESAIFGFKKDVSNLPAAIASAQRTADVQVKAAKISGMSAEDIQQAYKYGATPARLAGLSEEQLLAFSGILKKANMGGDESGVAFRALVAAGLSPTRKAKESMLANGLDYKNYQRNPDHLDRDAFVKNISASYGIDLNARSQAALGRIFADKKLIADPSKFAPAVVRALKGSLRGDDAKSLKSIAGAANRYRDASMLGVDMPRFVSDLMSKIASNPALANAIFGSKQGGRIATALGDPATFQHMLEEILNDSQGYAQKVADERMSGFDGAVSKFEGAVLNLQTAVARAFDNNGSGGMLTNLTEKAGEIVQYMAEANPTLQRIGAGIAALAAGWGAVKSAGVLFGGFGLQGSAAALDGSAGLLDGAAAALTGAAGKLGGAATSQEIKSKFGDKAGDVPGLGKWRLFLNFLNVAGIGSQIPTNADDGKKFIAGNYEGAKALDGVIKGWLNSTHLGWVAPGKMPDQNPLLAPPVTAHQERVLDNMVNPPHVASPAAIGNRSDFEQLLHGAPLNARIAEPVDVTGKLDPVELKGQANVNIGIKVDGPAAVTSTSAVSVGNIKASVGTSMAGTADGGASTNH